MKNETEKVVTKGYEVTVVLKKHDNDDEGVDSFERKERDFKIELEKIIVD